MRAPRILRPRLLADAQEIDAVEHDGAAADAAAGPGEAHGGDADGRLAGARFADQPQHLAAAQRNVDAVDDTMPLIVGLALELEPAHFEQYVALGAAGLAIFAISAHSRNPLVMCRNQSTTKLTPTVNSAIAAAGSNGVMSPKVIRVALSRTILPQSASGG